MSEGLRSRNPSSKVVDLSSSKDGSSSPSVPVDAKGNPLPTFTPPNFTAKELISSIPRHCFERSALRSSAYVLVDFLMLAGLSYCALNYIDGSQGVGGIVGGFVKAGGIGEGLKGWSGVLGEVARWSAWATYCYLAGLVGTGIWVIAHECGHQSYSSSKFINNAVGWVLHSALLVPYHSWRISHGRHHSATGNMTRDQVFVPKTRSLRFPGSKPPTEVNNNGKEEGMLEKADDLLEDAPFWALLNLIGQQLIGWPAYLILNASGPAHYPKWTNHFQPSSVIYEPRHKGQILMSDLGVGITLAALTFWGQSRGWSEVVKMYLIPYLFVNHWLVLITYLQHTDPLLPHYRGSEWNFQRGALCTIDRNIHGWFFHGIAETHVAHHLASKIPHYHAWEATEALKKKLGPYYMKNEENFWISLWKSTRECRFVEDTGDIVFFKNGKGESHIVLQYEPPVSDSGVDVQ